MKTIPFELHGKIFYLCMNGAALFDIYDKFGADGNVTDPIEGADRKAFDATCWMLAKLSEQGAMVRRYQGHDRAQYLKEGELRAMLSPVEVIAAKKAIKDAVAAGFSMEVERAEDESFDPWLAEIEQAEGKNVLTRSQFLHAVTQLLHLGIKEGLLLTIGEVCDMLELEKQRRGTQKAGED